MHTEIYSLKGYVVFHTEISSSQSEERMMFFTRENNDTSNQKPKRCVGFAPKFPAFCPFVGACSLQRPLNLRVASQTFCEKTPQRRVTLLVFLVKK